MGFRFEGTPEGMLVTDVEPGSPSAAGGLKPYDLVIGAGPPGDDIVSIER